MKKLLIATALASCTLAMPAFAEDTGPYLTLEGGGVKQETVSVNRAGAPDHGDRFKTGWEAGAALGYDLGHFRIEAEGFYDRSALREQHFPLGIVNPAVTIGQANGVYGNTHTYALMGNALIGLGHWGGIKAYLGGGAGYARTYLVESTPGFVPVNDRSGGFAWQGLAGLTVPVGHNVDLGVRYRYFRPSRSHFIYADGGQRDVTLQSHSVLATLTFNFGKAAPAPVVEAAAPPPPPPMAAAPPPPPPPPVPMAMVCNKGPYIVFFDWNKSDISAEASNILDNAVTAYGNCASVPIMLAGYTDSSGTPQYNMGLAERRDQSVQGYLTSHGVSAGAISSHAYGEANQRVPTADGVRELQNRRVEISYGPGAGN